MINFIEHPTPGYAARTYANVRESDLTIAFATDFTTAGERLTKKATVELEKLFIPVEIRMDTISLKRSADSMNSSIKLLMRGISFNLNIAGNGIYSLSKAYTQKDIDDYIAEYLAIALNGIAVKYIRSGGQTGVDEAGVKFGNDFGYETICCFPKGWMFRDITGADITDRDKFMERFYIL